MRRNPLKILHNVCKLYSKDVCTRYYTMHIGGYYTLQHSDQCTSLIKLSIKPPIDVNLHIYKNLPCNFITMIACQINYNWLQFLISCRLLFLNHAPLHTFTKLHQKELYHGSMVAAKPYQNPIRVSPPLHWCRCWWQVCTQQSDRRIFCTSGSLYPVLVPQKPLYSNCCGNWTLLILASLSIVLNPRTRGEEEGLCQRV